LKQFISVKDVNDIDALVAKALSYKANPHSDKTLGSNKRIGCIFLNPSMRTRLSTQVAAQNLGMEAIVFNAGSEGWAMEFEDGAVMNGTTVEHVKDAAPVLGKYFDILAIRTFPGLKDREADYSEFYMNQFIRYCGIPVISLESATLHPLQSLADVITIKENWKETRKPKVVLTWAPHVKALPQCVANSFSEWMNAWGETEFVIAHPPGYTLSKDYTCDATILHNQDEALKGADFIYVKNWSSYEAYGAMPPVEGDWMLTNEKLGLTNHAKVMHCLPVRRNVELSDEILDSNNSIITQQAGNRVWSAQAVISEILNG
jgi:N-succinyl-L-ornithine transcarbamylase